MIHLQTLYMLFFVLIDVQFFIGKYNFMSFYKFLFPILQTIYLLKLSNQHIMDTNHYKWQLLWFFQLSLIFKMPTKILLETNILYTFITLSYFYHQDAWVWYLRITRYTDMLWPFDDSCWLKRGIWSKTGNGYLWVYCKTKILICTRQYCCDLQGSVLAFQFTKGFVCRARRCQCYPRNKRRLNTKDSFSW